MCLFQLTIMKPIAFKPTWALGRAFTTLAYVCLAAMPVSAAPAHDPAALDVLRSVQGKLASSTTLAVEARRSTSWDDQGDGPVSVTVQRPNLFLARQGKGMEEKVLAYDGTTLRFHLPGVLLHAEGKLMAPDAPALADAMQERFGFRPPLAELLAPDLVKEMARDGATITMGKSESVGWTKCHHLIISQPGQTTEIWVGAKDSLPRRYRITFDDASGRPWMETRFKKWKFAVPTTPDLFRPAPAAGSHAVELLKSR